MASNVKSVKRILWVYLIIFWWPFSYASELTFEQGVETISLKVILYVLVLSVAGGAAATLPKIADPNVKLKNNTLEVIKDAVCSFVAGLIIFFAMMEWSQPWSRTCLAILLGGAGNAKFIDLLLNNGFFPRVASFLGKTPEPTKPPPPSIQAGEELQ